MRNATKILSTLLVDGNALENLHLFDDSAKNLALIMKDGAIYQNTLQ